MNVGRYLRGEDVQQTTVRVAMTLNEQVAIKAGWYKANVTMNGRNMGSCWWHSSMGDPACPKAGASTSGYPNYVKDAFRLLAVPNRISIETVYRANTWRASKGYRHEAGFVESIHTDPNIAICEVYLRA